MLRFLMVVFEGNSRLLLIANVGVCIPGSGLYFRKPALCFRKSEPREDLRDSGSFISKYLLQKNSPLLKQRGVFGFPKMYYQSTLTG